MLKRIVHGLFYLFLLVLIFIIYLYYSTSARLNGQYELPGLYGKVFIVRDQFGIPHINAVNDDCDAFFALGYVQAQDRLWQMEFQRRIVQGRLSEIFGKTTLSKDIFLRTWGFYRAAQQTWQALDPKSQEFVHSYTQGINAFIKQNYLPIPFKLLRFKPEPWTDIDSIAWSKMMCFDLEDVWKTKITNYLLAQQFTPQQIAQLLPPYPADAPTVLSDNDLAQNDLLKLSNAPTNTSANVAPLYVQENLTHLAKQINDVRDFLHFSSVPGKGSNSWVVNDQLTRSGKPLLANDPHLRLQEPAVWYLVELRGPHLHLTGATLTGIPAMIIGHNDHIAWGITNVNANTQDLYIEPSTAKLTTREETIAVRGASPVKITIYTSEHGPIINHVGEFPAQLATNNINIALAWPALRPNDTTPTAFMYLGHAQNWQEFVNALSYFVAPAQNFVYADTAGNIGYYLAGKIPLRQNWLGNFPIMPNQHLEWNGFIPFAQLPHVLNPATHYIVSANNKSVSDRYLYPINFRWDTPPFRAERILELIQQLKPLNIVKCKFMQHDVNEKLWVLLKPLLLNTKPQNELSQQALALLANWNGKMQRDSAAATIFATWYRQLTFLPLTKIKFTHEWKEPYFIIQQLSENGDYCKQNGFNDCQAYLSATLTATVNSLKQQLGDNPVLWFWGILHEAKFNFLGLGESPWLGWIWRHAVPSSGDDYTVNAGTYKDLNNFTQSWGADLRIIMDLNNVDNTQVIIAPGQSENIFSPYFSNLLPVWQHIGYIPLSGDRRLWGKTNEIILRPGE